jgi:hypothetical protein
MPSFVYLAVIAVCRYRYMLPEAFPHNFFVTFQFSLSKQYISGWRGAVKYSDTGVPNSVFEALN